MGGDYLWGMSATQEIRAAYVAGQFYPGEAQALRRDIRRMLAEASREKVRYGTTDAPGIIKALIVPHAGYIYSGPIAASAYSLLFPRRDSIRRVVVLGPVHRVPVRGLALPGSDVFETPLGTIPVDSGSVEEILSLGQVLTSRAAHAMEHSIEVQLPFLQEVLGDFRLLPLAVGNASPGEVAQVIEALWGGPETLFVISSDLSHYLPYDIAHEVDSRTCGSISDLQQLGSHEQACGATPVNGMLLAARHHQLVPHLLDLRNSGDTAGDRGRVVGYAAFAFMQEVDGDR